MKGGDIVTTLLIIGALVVVLLVVLQFQQGIKSYSTVIYWDEMTSQGNAQGSEIAPITIVEFTDYECRYCKRAQATTTYLKQKYKGQIRFIYRHLPLKEIHDFSVLAAIAVECAADQGRFYPYHLELFEHQSQLQNVSWSNLADKAGVQNIEKYSYCVKKELPLNRIQNDMELARSENIRSVPTFILNGKILSGVVPASVFDEIIQNELATAGY